MICKVCGEEISDGVKFCPECGANLTENNDNEIGQLAVNFNNADSVEVHTVETVVEDSIVQTEEEQGRQTIIEGQMQMVENHPDSTKEKLVGVTSEKEQSNDPKQKMPEAVSESEAVDNKKKINGTGLTGFILSLCSIFIFGIILSILGIVFSSIGLATFKKDTQRGRGFAIAGLVISIVALFILLIF